MSARWGHKPHTFIVQAETVNGDHILRVIKAHHADEARRLVEFKYLGRIKETSVTVDAPIYTVPI